MEFQRDLNCLSINYAAVAVRAIKRQRATADRRFFNDARVESIEMRNLAMIWRLIDSLNVWPENAYASPCIAWENLQV